MAGAAVELKKSGKNQPWAVIAPESRYQLNEETVGLTPSSIGAIFADANTGAGFHRLAKLSLEILEKSWDIAQAVNIRAACVSSQHYDIVPPQGEKNKEPSEWLKNLLSKEIEDPKLLDFSELLRELAKSAYLPGLSVAEIIWKTGGTDFTGFQAIEAHHFTYYQSKEPRLRTSDHLMDGEELPSGRFITHYHLPRGGDPTRGGLIRPLAWIYAFQNIVLKDALRYVEKFGIPYVMATIKAATSGDFEEDAKKLNTAIKNFGSDGGGTFSDAATMDFKTPNQGNNKGGEIFFTFMNEFIRGIAKVVLGQTSTSDSTNSNRSTAEVHNLVRHDILVADCKALAQTLRHDLFTPLIRSKYGNDTPVPVLSFDVHDWATLEELAGFLKGLHGVGIELKDVEEISRRAGMQFTKGEKAPAYPNQLPNAEKLEPLDYRTT